MHLHANMGALENLCVRTVGKRFLLEKAAAEQLYEICRMSRPATDCIIDCRVSAADRFGMEWLRCGGAAVEQTDRSGPRCACGYER
jgi:hypothetical protein